MGWRNKMSFEAETNSARKEEDREREKNNIG